ncbi:MAG: hypothetical protein H6858_01850 [Rhodospirillales bacterium]|nr:hypothetical protein [Alphaproteobacteria bacterium]MCB1841201.1 hypothetical protein [Alphaproteobacteria bacterium]MCB9976327.1 hypothetical protein [Rhodospirillales bacterium]
MKTDLSDVMNSEIILPDDGHYLVVTNFAYTETITGEPVNTYSGLTGEAFNYLMEDTIERMEAEVVFCDGNTAIIQGTPDSLKLVERLCGDRFSYAYCNVEAADRVMDRCIQAAVETPEEREARRVPGFDYVQNMN